MLLKVVSGLIDLLYVSFGVPTTSRSPALESLEADLEADLPLLPEESGEKALAYWDRS
jgi:hypothetical protein